MSRFTKTILVFAVILSFGLSKNVHAKKTYDFKLKDYKGRTVKLSDYKGKYIHVDFSADWCGPCHMQATYIKEVEEELGSKNFVSFTILISNPNKETLKKWRRKYKIKHLLVDPKGKVKKRFIAGGIPANVILKPDLTLAGNWVGAAPSKEIFIRELKRVAPGLFKKKTNKASLEVGSK
ncbi:MAG TPA: TlpA family protein disulfide reductase, partial [Spirochaetes bacterium]|nr:TlpA family protein disulfide reductase [Spirochaetota bacterium]